MLNSVTKMAWEDCERVIVKLCIDISVNIINTQFHNIKDQFDRYLLSVLCSRYFFIDLRSMTAITLNANS